MISEPKKTSDERLNWILAMLERERDHETDQSIRGNGGKHDI